MPNPQVTIGGSAVAVPKNGTLGTTGAPGIQLFNQAGSLKDVFTGATSITPGTTYTSSTGATIFIDGVGNATIRLPAGYTAVGAGVNYYYAVSTSTQGPWSGVFDVVTSAPPSAPTGLTATLVY